MYECVCEYGCVCECVSMCVNVFVRVIHGYHMVMLHMHLYVVVLCI